ncbi:Rieske (2Fe-2S) domain protein [Chloroherpeton thalassium ATCC 35110]|uniref:Rieske (2Fe-2S) domain protein n=1 Tax=Chloroherpeton thalassium (strain ATCC 35110 / GB-78) TaxID=517418 RepID=B3QX45_CHLT3|nr:Rieske 2Fe-2S domain-containing protein [Chloroherpeton thalassium]ACF14855.1 Rieske (2Fe-2S) domain protein [Chloroherpeton thalassium ATCC 35110]
MELKSLNRNIFQRLVGLSATGKPKDGSCWKFENGKLIIELAKAPELSKPFGALRFEENGLQERVLVVKGDDGFFYAFKNHCTHSGRRLDPIPGTETVQCCSVGKSTFDFGGLKKAGAAKADIKTYGTMVKDNRLIVHIK